MYLSLFLVLTSLLAFGQSKIVDGPCPITIKEITTFDINRYLGKWYDVYYEQSPWICSNSVNCSLAYYRSYLDEKHVYNLNYYSFDGPYKSFCAFGLYQNDFDIDARLFRDPSDDSVYILDTDYDNYAVEVGCFGNGETNSHEERTIIRSRTRSMDKDLVEKLKKKVIDFGFAEPNLIEQSYESCPEYEPW